MSEDATAFYVNSLRSHGIVDFELFETNFREINELLPSPSRRLKDILKSYLSNISGIESLLVPNMTIHETLDEMFELENPDLVLIHPIDSITRILEVRGIKEVLIFGTSYTMKEGYLSGRLEHEGIAVSFPEKTEIEEIDAFRRNVFQNKVSSSMLRRYQSILHQYSQRTNVLLACTELSMHYNTQMENVYDLVHAQIQTAQQWAAQ